MAVGAADGVACGGELQVFPIGRLGLGFELVADGGVVLAGEGEADLAKCKFALLGIAHDKRAAVDLHAVEHSGALVAGLPQIGDVPAPLVVANQQRVHVVEHQFFNGGLANQAAPTDADFDFLRAQGGGFAIGFAEHYVVQNDGGAREQAALNVRVKLHGAPCAC